MLQCSRATPPTCALQGLAPPSSTSSSGRPARPCPPSSAPAEARRYEAGAPTDITTGPLPHPGSGPVVSMSQTLAAISSPIWEVERTSGVPAAAASARAAMSASIAARTRSASSANPMKSSMSATEEMVAVGSALPCPAMSGAEPCTGSNMEGYSREGFRLPDALRPMPPVTAPASSVRMSPKRLSVTITSKRPGSVTM